MPRSGMSFAAAMLSCALAFECSEKAGAQTPYSAQDPVVTTVPSHEIGTRQTTSEVKSLLEQLKKQYSLADTGDHGRRGRYINESWRARNLVTTILEQENFPVPKLNRKRVVLADALCGCQSYVST